MLKSIVFTLSLSVLSQILCAQNHGPYALLLAERKRLAQSIDEFESRRKQLKSTIDSQRMRIHEVDSAIERARMDRDWAHAGVIPFSVASDGQIYILFGKEKEEGEGLRCTFFVGGRESLESPFDTAAQEFWEETRHAYSREYVHSRLDRTQMIYNSKGFMFVVKVPYVSEHRLNKLKDVPNDEKLPDYFWVPLNAIQEALAKDEDIFNVKITYRRRDRDNEWEDVTVHLYSKAVADLKCDNGRNVIAQIEKAEGSE